MDRKKILALVIILLVVILVILIAVLVRVSSMVSNELQENIIITEENQEEESHVFFKQVNDYTTFYSVKNILNNYTEYVKQVNGDLYIDPERVSMEEEELKATTKESGIITITALLDEEYLSNMNINEETIIEKQQVYLEKGDYSEDVIYSVTISNMLIGELKENLDLVLVNAMINDEELNLLVKLDQTNKTYSIFYEDYIEAYGYNEETTPEQIQISDNNIEVNEYNTYTEAVINDEYLVTQYFSEYRSNMLYNTQQAYELLDPTYREKKFGSYENFVNYISNNNQEILTASISGYEINEFEGIKEYVCIDQYGKYYIFSETNIASFDVILDIYTVDLPDFLEQYNSSNDPDKAGMNLQKIVDALNDGDYGYIYEKLDSTFRQNNFATQADFETYITTNLYTNCSVEFSDYESSADLHIFKATFTDNDDPEKVAIEKTFILQLGEGTDFVFSFNVQ